MTLLTVRDLRFRYGSNEVLRGTGFDLGPGSCLAVVGRNGSGKSTLARVCAGRDRPSGGRVTLDGRPMDDDDPWVRRRVATVTGQRSHYPDLTVREHLDLVAVAHADPEPRRTVDRALAQLRLTEVADAFPQHLSSGQAQALNLASVRVRPRRVVILDEPEQHLDTTARSDLAAWIAAEARAGVSVLLISHDPAVVAACADRTLLLQDGVLQDGALQDGALTDPNDPDQPAVRPIPTGDHDESDA